MTSIRINQALVAATLACAAMGTFAQDTMKPAAPMQKKDMTMQECKDRVTTSKGEKRNDTPASAETDKACSDMMKDGDHKKMKKHSMPNKESGTTPEMPK